MYIPQTTLLKVFVKKHFYNIYQSLYYNLIIITHNNYDYISIISYLIKDIITPT